MVIERRSGAAFGRFRYFIITPDRFMDKQVRQALHRLKVPDKDVFSEAIPSNMNLGLGADADDFVTLIRYAMPLDGGGEGSPSDGWRHNPPLTVLRVRDTRPHRPPQLYPAWVDNSPERRTAVDERGLKASLTQLVKQVSERWGQPCGQDDCADRALSFIDVQSYPMNLVGPLCDNIGMDCLGDTQDASYQFRPGFSFDHGEVYAVAGTLGTVTGNATYVSLAVNNTHLRLGAVNVNGDELRGSAASYAVADNPDKFYVHYFTRDCTGLETLTSGYCTSIEDTEIGVPAGVDASFVERDYIRVGTQRGPDSKLLLPSVVLKLQRPAH